LDSLFAGTYNCQVRDAHDCLIAVSDIVVDNLLATNEASWNQNVRLFPNPTTGLTQVLLPAGLTGQALIRVFDGTGQLITSVQITMDERVWMLDLSNFSSGLYSVQLVSKGQSITVPLVKISSPN
jgi:hypothetical protein